MLESPVPSKPSSTPLHKLSWVGLFLAAGALAAWVVFGRNGESEPTGEAAPAPVSAARLDGAHADGVPAVERRSLMVDGSKPSDRAEGGPARSGADDGDSDSAETEATARNSAIAATGSSGGLPATVTPAASRVRTSSTLAAETRAALMRGSATQRVARAAVNPPPRRKRPARSDVAETASNNDAELDGLFTTPEPERPRSAEGELDGMFPRDETVTVGANGAPLPD